MINPCQKCREAEAVKTVGGQELCSQCIPSLTSEKLREILHGAFTAFVTAMINNGIEPREALSDLETHENSITDWIECYVREEVRLYDLDQDPAQRSACTITEQQHDDYVAALLRMSAGTDLVHANTCPLIRTCVYGTGAGPTCDLPASNVIVVRSAPDRVKLISICSHHAEIVRRVLSEHRS